MNQALCLALSACSADSSRSGGFRSIAMALRRSGRGAGSGASATNGSGSWSRSIGSILLPAGWPSSLNAAIPAAIAAGGGARRRVSLNLAMPAAIAGAGEVLRLTLNRRR